MKVIGDGSVTRLEKKPRSKCRRWRLRVQTDAGERTKRYRGTYSDALTSLEQFKSQICQPENQTTFKERANTWLERRKTMGDIAASTIDKNSRHINALNMVFGDMAMIEIDKGTVIDGLARIKAGENPSGKQLSGTYLNQMYMTMKSIFDEAIEDGIVTTNPLDRIKAPKVDTAERKAIPQQTLLQALQIMETSALSAQLVAVLIAVLGGLRRGEIMALRWCDISDDAISVSRSFDEKSGKINPPKTKSGVRKVPIGNRLKESLDKWKLEQSDKLKTIGVKQTDETPVVSSATGEYMHPQNLNRWWRNSSASFGLKGYTIHELRHTFLTVLANSGANVWALQNIAGWSNVKMASIYVHEDADANAKAVSNMDAILTEEITRDQKTCLDREKK